MLTVPGEESEKAMTRARGNISLQDLGIASVEIKRTRAGGLILGVPEPDGREKPDRLAARMAKVLEGTGARISRPVKYAEFRVTGLETSVKIEEVCLAISAAGKCSVGDVTIGQARWTPTGKREVRAKAPIAAAGRITASGRIVIGWASA